MVGGFQGGHGKANLQLGAVCVLCARCAETPPKIMLIPQIHTFSQSEGQPSLYVGLHTPLQVKWVFPNQFYLPSLTES